MIKVWRLGAAMVQQHAFGISIAAHALVAGSCGASIATQPLTWWTVWQSGVMAWCVGAIWMLIIIERAKQQNRLTLEILEAHRKSIDTVMELQIENFAMRQYFRANDIEFKVTRDGDSISATTEHKGAADEPDAIDDPAGEDRTVH